MSASPLNDVPESPDERMQRRRARRWKRRARIAGPFLGIPLLVGTLALSVDLIEYDPQPEHDRLSDRPMPQQVVDKAATRRANASSPSVSGASVVDPGPSAMANELDLQLEDGAGLLPAREFAPPPAPYALRGSRL